MVTVTTVSLQQRHAAVRRAVETRRVAEKLLFEVHDEIGNAVGGSRARAKLGEIAVEYLERLAGHQTRDPELAWELMSAYSRLAQSRGGAPSSLGDTKSAAQLAIKALALGAIVESAGPDDERLDKLFAAYDALAPIFAEAGRPAEQREAVDRMLRLAPRLRPLRQAQALKRLANCFDERNMPQQSAEIWARTLAVLRSLPDAAATRSETSAQLASTLVGYGRTQALAGDFTGAVFSLQEVIRLLQSRTASEPPGAKSARQLYWSYIALGDVFGSPVRFSMGNTADAVREYQKAQSVAEELVKADPANDMAKLDLARALSREGAAVAASQPAAALALLERAYKVAAQTSANNYSGLESRFTYLTSSVPPLVELGRFERARSYVAEAGRLAKQMRMERSAADDKSLLKAEAILLYATGHQWEAMREVEKHLSLLPNEIRPVLNENFARIELLERLRVYAAGLDAPTCAAASQELVRIWTDLRAKHPASVFIRRQAERAQASQRNACEFQGAAPAKRQAPRMRRSSGSAQHGGEFAVV
jgi:tetratricopeptide (TPR) repeat protein